MNEEQTGQIVGTILAAYPREEVGAETVDLYHLAISKLDYLATQLALEDLIARSRFFPTIAEVLEAVAERQLELPSVVEAWEQAQERANEHPEQIRCDAPGCADGFLDEQREVPCERCGGEGYRTVYATQLHPLVKRALAAMGGPVALREAPNAEVFRSQFMRIYSDARAGAIRDLVTRRREREEVAGAYARLTAPPAPPSLPGGLTGTWEPAEALTPEESAERARELLERLEAGLKF